MKLWVVWLGCLLAAGIAKAQDIDYSYRGYSLFWVELTDKDQTPYSVFHPQEFLSPRALARRTRMGIGIEENDLPVDPAYIRNIEQMGASIHARSKWFNSLAIHTQDTALLKRINALPFVKRIRPLGYYRAVTNSKLDDKRPKINTKKHTSNYYGEAFNQIRMLGGDVLHSFGYTGEGVHVAVFDGGFTDVYRMRAFDSLYANHRLLGTHDFVENDEQVYESSHHGTNVLGTMATNMPYLMVGTAPEASYYLFKTEDVKGEFRIEEFNWVAALERADSLGVDVVNSSLGYTGFNDTLMSYKYAQLNGATALSSRGANIGASKGLLIVNSAGNEGSGPWHYIGTPADAPGVLAVAAVRPNGKRASFSSWGPTPDGRIKPDIAAQGRFTVVPAIHEYDVTRTNGTSFSSPVMAGMVASLRSAFPDLTGEQLKQAIRQSGSIATEPDSSLGYGIPNFFFAYISLLDASIILDQQGRLYYTPLPIDDQLHLFIERPKGTPVELRLYTPQMQRCYEQHLTIQSPLIEEIRLPNLENYTPGVYILELVVNHVPYWLKIVKE